MLSRIHLTTKGALFLLPLALLLVAGSASSAIYHHKHEDTGSTTITTEGITTATNKFETQVEAPTIGTVNCKILQDGRAYVYTAVTNGGCWNNAQTIPAMVNYRNFQSVANITSGIGKAWLWTADETEIPVPCPSGGGS